MSYNTDNSDQIKSDLERSIVFKSTEADCFHLNGNTAHILISSGNHDHGSSKVKLKNIVDYKWELRHYRGHLITVHNDGDHIAYAINVNRKSSGMEGMVRVVHAQSGDRALIKGMTGEILDIQFAHTEKQRILASIDVQSLYIHAIELVNGTLTCNLLIKIEDSLQDYSPSYDKICWCPYVELSLEEDDDDSQLIVWARGSLFQCFNINTIVRENGIGTIYPENLTSGYVKMKDDSIFITWVALSPDGSTLSVGSTDGVIKFYQVYMFEEELRCLHQWTPHNGKSISSFFFLDDVSKKVADTYWKFAITGAVNNTEVKLWDCGSWECIQTILFSSSHLSKQCFRLIADIDKTASYFILSSLENRTCYVLDINRQHGNYAKSSSNDGKSNQAIIQLGSVCEFPLSSGILSFSIVDATVRDSKYFNDEFINEIDEYDNDSPSIVDIRMFIVQCKSMQECHILYKQNMTRTITKSETSKFSTSPLLKNIAEKSSHDETILSHIDSPIVEKNKVNFNSSEISTYSCSDHSSHKNVTSDVFNTILMLANATSQSIESGKSDNQSLINNEDKLKNSEDLLINRKPQCGNDNLMSGGSSPSREVQEILSLRVEKESLSDDEVSPCSQSANGIFVSPMSKKLENLTESLLPESSINWVNSSEKCTVLKINSNNEAVDNVLKLSATKELSTNSDDLNFSHEGTDTNLFKVGQNIKQLMEMVNLQTKKVDSLQKDLTDVKKATNILNSQVTELSLKLNAKISNLEYNLKRYESENYKKLASVLVEENNKRRSLCEEFVQMNNDCLLSQYNDIQNKIIADCEQNITPIILEKINNMHQQIQTTLSQRNYLFNEHVSTNWSKEVNERFNSFILENLQKSLQSAFIDCMSSTLIPAYEKSSQKMFQQLHDTFSIGIKEFLDQFYVCVNNCKPSRESFDEATEEISALRLTLQNVLTEHRNLVTGIIRDTQSDIKNLEISLAQHIQEAVCFEFRKYMDFSSTTVPQNKIPVCTYNLKDTIKSLVQQGQLNKAFHQALLVNDFNLVEFTLQLADHHSVFNPSCCLDQKVLLSLIQQISADMNNHNEIKQNYLAEALLAINPLDPVTKEHAPKILQELYRNCQKFLKNSPKSLQCSNVRMLMKGVEAYKDHFQQ